MSNSHIESMSQSAASRQLALLQPAQPRGDNGRNFSAELERSIHRTSRDGGSRESAQNTAARAGDKRHAQQSAAGNNTDRTRGRADGANADKIEAAKKALAKAAEKGGEDNREAASIAALAPIIAALQSEGGRPELDLDTLAQKGLGGQTNEQLLMHLTQLMDGDSRGRGNTGTLDTLLRQQTPTLRGFDALSMQQLQTPNSSAGLQHLNIDAEALDPDALPLEKTLLTAERDTAGNRLMNIPAQDTMQAGLNTQVNQSPSSAARADNATPPPQLPVQTPVGQKAWADDMGNRLSWMVGRNESKAELMLTPPNMGKLSVSLQINGDQTNAQFVAANQATREALEQAIPRLREALQQAGINLGQADVSTSSEHQAQGDDGGDDNERDTPLAASGNSDMADNSLPASGQGPAGWRNGLGAIDIFA